MGTGEERKHMMNIYVYTQSPILRSEGNTLNINQHYILYRVGVSTNRIVQMMVVMDSGHRRLRELKLNKDADKARKKIRGE